MTCKAISPMLSPSGLLRLGLTLFMAVAMIAAANTAQAARRVALVIGNSAYQHTAPLPNPVNDAAAVASSLRRLGFKVIEGRDLDYRQLKRILRDFARAVQGSKVALFYYAGHGLRVAGKNYLVPVDAGLKLESDIDFEAIELQLVLKQLERGKRTNIVLLDSCRNNPLIKNLTRSMGTRAFTVGRGLARVETGIGTFVGFATQPGAVAVDGEGKHSPFTAALVKYLNEPGLDISVLMRKVRQEVIAATNGQQVPWSNSSLIGEAILNPLKQPVKKDVTPAAVAKTAPGAENVEQPGEVRQPAKGDGAGDADSRFELAFWESIRNSKNPELFKAYLERYPNGAFAGLARRLIASLANPAKVEEPPVQAEEPPVQTEETPPEQPLIKVEPRHKQKVKKTVKRQPASKQKVYKRKKRVRAKPLVQKKKKKTWRKKVVIKKVTTRQKSPTALRWRDRANRRTCSRRFDASCN